MPGGDEGLSSWFLTFHDEELELEFQLECSQRHQQTEKVAVVEPLIYLMQAAKLLSFGNHILMAVYLVLAAVASARIYVALHPRLPLISRMNYRDCIAGLLHPCAFLSHSFFIKHVYWGACSSVPAFWGAQLLASSMAWLLPVPLTNGLLYKQLVVSQGLAVAAVAGTCSIRCSQAEAACPEAGERYLEVAQLLTAVSSPFMAVGPVRLSSRCACCAVLALLQVGLGFFGVLALKRCSEVGRRRRFVATRGRQGLQQRLDEMDAEQHDSLMLMSGYLVLSLTWQAILLVTGSGQSESAGGGQL